MALSNAQACAGLQVLLDTNRAAAGLLSTGAGVTAAVDADAADGDARGNAVQGDDDELDEFGREAALLGEEAAATEAAAAAAALYSREEAETNLAALSTFGRNFLPILFNCYDRAMVAKQAGFGSERVQASLYSSGHELSTTHSRARGHTQHHTHEGGEERIASDWGGV